MSCQQLGCCHCDRDLIMLYFIPATISPAEEVEKPPRTPSCHCRSSQLLYSYCTTQSFLQKCLRNHHWELGLHHFYRCSIHINSIAGTPLTLTMINTGMWIQGRFLGGRAGNQLEQMLVRNKMCAAASARNCFSIGVSPHLSPALQDQCILLTTEIVRAMSRRNPSAVASTM
jgi:hypothetical protein